MIIICTRKLLHIMEKRLNNKLETYFKTFKDNVRDKIISLQLNDQHAASELMAYIYDYERLNVDKGDFVKRKRVKNSIPEDNRCMAKRANGEQCTRRRKDDSCEFCGTHSKGTPHGLIDSKEEDLHKNKQLEVFAQEIKGIVYWIDHFHNVYNTEDVMMQKLNPNVIGKWCCENGVYSIPNLGL